MEIVHKFEDGLPIKSWVKNLESGALEQAINLAQLPFVFRHIALMPDAHQGYGMPIGGVMATQGVIVPNAVGVDIGCGMRAVCTDFLVKNINSDEIKEIMGQLREVIPVGFNHHENKQINPLFLQTPEISIIQQEWDKAQYQLGTLGGGNHFIELQAGNDGYLWLMIHSGSRNFGFKIANEYHKKAKQLCERWYSNIPHLDLSFFPIESKEGKEYYEAMKFALLFAKVSRAVMMDNFKEIVESVLGAAVLEEIDVHHNYAQFESHFGKDVLVHRKGAILARKNLTGIIPGSQGSSSYITRGLGNPESFNSSSHGAGRTMSRKKARETLIFEDQVQKLNDLGVIHSVRNKKDLDEAPGVYKDIDEVMGLQWDLCDIVTKLKPLGVIKA